MSTPQESATHCTYPLSPSPNSELRKSSQPLSASFGAPRTPQSPLDGTSQPHTSALPTAQLHSMHDMNSHSITGAEGRTTSPLAMDVNMNRHDDDGTLKRKYEFGDSDEHEDKRLHVEDRKPSISDLHIDVGKIYQLCRTPHPPKLPSLSDDLFQLYGLESVAASVARFLPDGKKNGLRKTYKGKIKDLGINGKFDVSVQDEDAPGGLMMMMREPELEWNVSKVAGGLDLRQYHGKRMREDAKGWPMPQTPETVLRKALTFNPGIIPRGLWDDSAIRLDGDKDKTGAQKSGSYVGSQKTSSSFGALSGGNLGSLSSGYRPPKAQELARPKRAIKKRGYDESSFEGYGEGFVDDEMGDGGYSTGDGDERGGKRRKKVAPQSQYGSSRYSSYGPGSVGS